MPETSSHPVSHIFWESSGTTSSDWKTYLVGLAQAIDAPHFALLVRVGEHTHSWLLARDAEYEVFPALLCYVFPELAQEPRCPLLFHLNLLVLQQKTQRFSSRLCRRLRSWVRIREFETELRRAHHCKTYIYLIMSRREPSRTLARLTHLAAPFLTVPYSFRGNKHIDKFSTFILCFSSSLCHNNDDFNNVN